MTDEYGNDIEIFYDDDGNEVISKIFDKYEIYCFGQTEENTT